MLSAILAGLGFLAPFIPEAIKFFQKKQDHTQEIERMRVSAELQKGQDERKIVELNTQADIAEIKVIHQPQQSFGIQLLDKAHNVNINGFVLHAAFLFFCLIDGMNAALRSFVCYSLIWFYILYKWATLKLAMTYNEGVWGAVKETWTENDWALLLMVLSYFFGQRTAKAVFGKK